MKFEDTQIDVLLTGHGRNVKTSATTAGHLDADELNAFAEGATPAATRARYVSHLAECDDCRRLATQLAISAGVVAKVAPGRIDAMQESLWQKLATFFAPPTLRYAAFAAVLIGAVGVTFLALRHERESRLVAQNEPVADRQTSAAMPAKEAPPSINEKAQTLASPSGAISQPEQNANREAKQDKSQPVAGTLAPPKPEKEAVTAANNPVSTEKRAAESVIVEQQREPSFAPPPPGEAGLDRTRTREEAEREIAGVSGLRKAELPDKLKATDRSRAAEPSKDQRTGGPNNRATNNQQVLNKNTESRAESVRPTFSMSRAADESVVEERKPASSTGSDAKKTPEMRSVGGHKFRKQGNAWVDTKFKSSMAVTNVTRGSDEFRALDSDVRSIANQLGGEIVVVRKGKAYRIR